jgi:hypothetical protein
LHAAQDRAIALGDAVETDALTSIAAHGAATVDVEKVLRMTSVPRTVRDRAAARLGTPARLADVVVSLAEVAAACDREEGETYARAAGRLVLRAAAFANAAAAAAGGAPA